MTGRLLSTLLGFVLVGAFGFVAIHATVHPSEYHPAWWLIAAGVGLGAFLVDPAHVMDALRAARDFLPGRTGGQP